MTWFERQNRALIKHPRLTEVYTSMEIMSCHNNNTKMQNKIKTLQYDSYSFKILKNYCLYIISHLLHCAVTRSLF